MWINFSPNKKTTSKSKSLRPPVCYRWPKPSQQLSPFHRPAITLFNLDLHSTKKKSFEIPSYIPIKWVESHQFHVTASHIETPGFVAIFQQPPAPPSSQAALPMSRSREVAHRWQPHFIGCHCCHGESQQKTQKRLAKIKFLPSPSPTLQNWFRQDSMGTRRKPFGSPGWLGTAIRSKRRGISWQHGISQRQVDPHGRLESRH